MNVQWANSFDTKKHNLQDSLM